MYQPPSSISDIKAWVEAMSMLSNTAGWRLYDNFLATQEQAFLDQLDNAPDAHTTAKVVGGLKAIRRMRAWPKQQMDACLAVLRQETEAKLETNSNL